MWWIPLAGWVHQTWAMVERVQVREIDDAEGGRLLRIVRRGTGFADGRPRTFDLPERREIKKTAKFNFSALTAHPVTA